MEESSTNDKNVDWDSTDDTVKQKCKPKLVEKKPDFTGSRYCVDEFKAPSRAAKPVSY